MVIMISVRPGGLPRNVAVLLLLAAPAVTARAEWTVTPTIRVRESYSDNYNLAPPEQARGQFTTEVSPGIRVSTSTPRLQLALSYTLQQIAYSHQPDRTGQQLDAHGHGEIVPDWLFLDASATISAYNVSAFGPQLLDPTQSTSNGRTVRSRVLSPYLRHYFRGLATAVLRHDDQHTGSGGLLDVRSKATTLQLTGDNGGKGMNWDLNLRHVQTDDAAQTPITMEDVNLTLSYPVNTSIGTFVTAGYEKHDFHALGAAPRGKSGSVGGVWTPSPRTRLAASIGHRYFGKTYSLDAGYRLRNMFWTLNYSEDITSTHGEFLSLPPAALSDFLYDLWATRIPDPHKRRQAIQLFLAISQMLGQNGNVNFFSHRYYLQKQARLSGVYSTPRTTVALHLASTGRTAQTSSAIDSALLGQDQLMLTDRTRQDSIQLGWSWRMSARGTVTLGVSHSRARSLSTGREDHNRVLSLNLARQLSSRINGTIDIRHAHHTSNHGGNYHENSVGAALTLTF
ncbi:TIGR03016 family PEP-CTERM system-associated outer membrane protein [Duganella sp. CY15W]|uniref:TIGR03016 family PEP-CTERM system-associated outer membrane protein n=1 Tax=Duganella sp. CY15W TaxID=2692172 RepID=UPI00136F4650|nr:TIGR03016 family PEP-CTERM system-associated outer membrane protein [Duganella sp. CY15W]MYM28231.1 TIGR03016 family PEP-CTERM system-associated outer membrane protein [Duganella sp. CY15W]